jgi:hypothetical protein
MGLGSFFKNIGSNIASGAKKTKNFLSNAKSGISNAISSGSKKAWSAVKEYGPELAGIALNGAEYIAPHLGPVGEAVHTASKAVSPHFAKALGEKFDKGYNRLQEKAPDIETPKTREKWRIKSAIKSRLRSNEITKKVSPPKEYEKKTRTDKWNSSTC